MLNITDLTVSKELASVEMADVRGGFNPFAIFDASSSIHSKVADVQQGFAFNLAQGNAGEVTNNQAIEGGNGASFVPVAQLQDQYNDLRIAGIGNVSVS